MTSRNFLITSYNCYANYDQIKSALESDEQVKYFIGQYEMCPLTERLHLQCYIVFKTPQRWSRVQQILADSDAHCEITRGSHQDCIDYCSKEDTRFDGPYEFGDRGRLGQGTRNDVRDLVDSIEHGSSYGNIIEKHPVQFLKFHKGIDIMLQHRDGQAQNKFEQLEVIVYWGEPGCGKTRRAREEAGKFYLVPVPGRGQPLWFDGYCGENTIVIDDFDGSWIEFSAMLRILDGYNLERFAKKGGFVFKQWKRVFITSNQNPENWYPTKGIGIPPQLQRRITKIEEMARTEE